MLKRKEARESFNAKKHEEKLKKIKDTKPTKFLRRYKSGWILGNFLQVSYTGLVIVIAFTLLIIYIVIATQTASAITEDEAKTELNEAKKLIKDTNEKIRAISVKIHELETNENVLKNKIYSMNVKLIEHDNEQKAAKREYRHTLDLKPSKDNNVEKKVEEAKTKYDKALKTYNETKNEVTKLEKELVELIVSLRNLNIEKKILEDSLQYGYFDRLTKAKIAVGVKKSDVKFITISLSTACEQSKCMKYSDLVEYDNTVQKVSGSLVQVGDDIKRSTPKMKNYWAWYQQIPQFKLVTIDPDYQMILRASNIVVVPELILLTDRGNDKNRSIDHVKNERYEWHDVYVSDDCKSALVEPNKELIPELINFMKNNCDGEPISIPKKIKLTKTPFDINDSPSYAEIVKWNKIAKECKTKKCVIEK